MATPVALGNETWTLAPPGLGLDCGWSESVSPQRVSDIWKSCSCCLPSSAPWWVTPFLIWVISAGSMFGQKLAVTWLGWTLVWRRDLARNQWLRININALLLKPFVTRGQYFHFWIKNVLFLNRIFCNDKMLDYAYN